MCTGWPLPRCAAQRTRGTQWARATARAACTASTQTRRTSLTPTRHAPMRPSFRKPRPRRGPGVSADVPGHQRGRVLQRKGRIGARRARNKEVHRVHVEAEHAACAVARAHRVRLVHLAIQRREGQPVHCAAKGSPRIAWRHSQSRGRLRSSWPAAAQCLRQRTGSSSGTHCRYITWHCILHYLHYSRVPQSGPAAVRLAVR